ncbi:uncharacterized protein WM277_023520 [Molossus nigricans]
MGSREPVGIQIKLPRFNFLGNQELNGWRRRGCGQCTPSFPGKESQRWPPHSEPQAPAGCGWLLEANPVCTLRPEGNAGLNGGKSKKEEVQEEIISEIFTEDTGILI